MPVRNLSDVFSSELIYPDVPWERRQDFDDPASPKISGTSTYCVPSPDSLEGLRLTALANLGVVAANGSTQLTESDRASLRFDDEQEANFYKNILGPAYDEMLRDGVKWLVMKAVAQDALLYFGMSEDAADIVLARSRARIVDGLGEAPAGTTRPSPTSTGHTAPNTDGSDSTTASTDTPARTRARTSTRSSRKTRTDKPEQAAG